MKISYFLAPPLNFPNWNGAFCSKIFLAGPAADSLLALCNILAKSKNMGQNHGSTKIVKILQRVLVEKLTKILRNFIEGRFLIDIFVLEKIKNLFHWTSLYNGHP